MRKNLLVGVVLMVAAVAVVVVSAWFDLKLESAALLGLAVGAVVALVPDGSPGLRLGGFVTGIAAAWGGYLLRAGFLPDSTAGRAVAVLVVLGMCVAVAAATAGRVPLWSSLLGTAALAGAYEYTYAAAPPEVTSTSLSAVTALTMTAAVGFLAAGVLAPRDNHARRTPVPPAEQDRLALADMMENAR